MRIRFSARESSSRTTKSRRNKSESFLMLHFFNVRAMLFTGRQFARRRRLEKAAHETVKLAIWVFQKLEPWYSLAAQKVRPLDGSTVMALKSPTRLSLEVAVP